MYGLEVASRDNGVVDIELNRSEVHNAFDDKLISSLTDTLNEISTDDSVKVVCLKGRGKTFSAGADLNWMKRMAGYSHEENLADARALARMLRALNEVPTTTVALIQGAAMGGGVGLASCCDVVIAADDARFALSEVRLGIVPATISPYVVAAIGARHARRFMQSGERFDAATAMRIGLVHEVVPAAELLARGEEIIDALLKCGPNARRVSKELVFKVAGKPIDDPLIDYTAQRIATVRASDEGREGVRAFLEKRAPQWS
jgi:methylglutaconyl-CoA hydratase